VYRASRPIVGSLFARRRVHRADSAYARERRESMRARLARGDNVHVIGIGTSGHNSGVALVEVSAIEGVRLICNEEEERYIGIKHYRGYPEHSVDVVSRRLAERGVKPQDVHAAVGAWSYMDYISFGLQVVAEHLPLSLALFDVAAAQDFNYRHAWQAREAPRRLGRQLGLPRPMPIIGLGHHENHAYFSAAVSPFGREPGPIMVTVLDGYGDSSSVSLYVWHHGELRCLRSNRSMFDSLGVLYSVISSTQGGWTILSSEGRYMGAAAWGDNDRLTNPYYRRLRQLLYFGDDGQVFVNRRMINWHKWGEVKPYAPPLAGILGDPIPAAELWNPDRVLSVDEIEHSPITQDRVDKAAAVQLLFEDALFHVIDYLIGATGSNRLVMAGGTALNCVANMRLLEHFDERYYKRRFGTSTRLHLWVPPTPGDAGAPVGAAYQFALTSGARAGQPLRHAFYCGAAPSSVAIRRAIEAAHDIGSLRVGDITSGPERDQVADLLAYLVSEDGIVGLFQGPAETGPRALGHRSIVANPCNPNTMDNINRHVKLRERIRPLAPMATLDAARRYFELSPGAADDDYNAYNYMVLTARARPESYGVIPAVVHRDGTSRVQIVRKEIDPFTYAYLRGMGRRVGVEVSVNTSLNVGSPIAQTPEQALEALRRARALSALLLIGAEGDAFLAWHDVRHPPKDGGDWLMASYERWQHDAPALVTTTGRT
jgi:carbamoyltransferase